MPPRAEYAEVVLAFRGQRFEIASGTNVPFVYYIGPAALGRGWYLDIVFEQAFPDAGACARSRPRRLYPSRSWIRTRAGWS